MRRYGQIIKIVPEKIDDYKKLHSEVWPEVLSIIKACNIQNYSIYLKEGFLFSYYEYVGNDYDLDMQKMSDDPITQEWWKLCMPCQAPVESANESDWWSDMEEVFHVD